jgi:hypothetical protein
MFKFSAFLDITLSKCIRTTITRTAWAVFKYCGTKTATIGLSIRSLYKVLVLGLSIGSLYKVLVMGLCIRS